MRITGVPSQTHPPSPPPQFRYRQLVNSLSAQIRNGSFRVGEKLPSIRRLHKDLKLSISTVYKAYTELETIGLVEARPKSGYYVCPDLLEPTTPTMPRRNTTPPQRVNLGAMVPSIVSAMCDPSLLPLASSAIDSQLLPYRPIARILKSLTASEIGKLIRYTYSEGDPELRRRIALRALGQMDSIDPNQVVITNGCAEAVSLALRVITRPGDTIAVEAPTHFGLLQLLTDLDIRVVAIPTDPRTGLILSELEKALHQHPVRACLLIPNFQNPLGALMPEDRKQALVGLLNRHRIPIIEDDIYGDLQYGAKRPNQLRVYDQEGLVLTCSSFSKTLAPGLRIGWVVAGQPYIALLKQLKASLNVATSTLSQHVLVRYLKDGAYDRHLRRLRAKLQHQTYNVARTVLRHFPKGTQLAAPQGGALLWVQLPQQIDGTRLYEEALQAGIAILPGAACALDHRFHNYVRLGCGTPFTPRIETGIVKLGQLATGLRTQRRSR